MTTSSDTDMRMAAAASTTAALGSCSRPAVLSSPRHSSRRSASGTAAASPEEVVAKIASAAKSRGFDITVGFTLQDYNAAVESDGLALPTFKRSQTLAVLLGSTKTIWSPFLHALRTSDPVGHLPGEELHDGPLNAFVVTNTEALTVEVLTPLGIRCESRYANEMGKGRLVAMQKLAQLSGCAYLHPSCGLNVHPVYGPWHAYRSLMIIDMDGVPTAGPPPNPSDPNEVAAAEAALKAALASTVDPTATNTKEEMDEKQQEVWRLWQRIRRALSSPAFADWTYDDEQDMYHFTHSPEVLARLVAQGEADDKAASKGSGNKQSAVR